jgi:hypothetical protein
MSIPDRRARFRVTSVCPGFLSGFLFGGPGFNLTGLVPEQVHGIHASEAYFRLFGAPVVLRDPY